MNRDWIVPCGSALVRSLTRGDTLATTERRIRDVARKSLPEATDREIAGIVKAALDLARRARRLCGRDSRAISEFVTRTGEIAGLEKAGNAAIRGVLTRNKKKALRELIRNARAQDEPCVFYAISTHQKPRCSHRALQGTVVYDRMFRSVLTRAGKWYLIRDVERAIRASDMMSVQEAVRAPYYISTAPYCRHRFCPLDTKAVLSGTANTVIRDGAPRSKTDAQRYREKKRRMKEIRERSMKKALR